jgi:hypothetical protein
MLSATVMMNDVIHFKAIKKSTVRSYDVPMA